MIIHVRNKTRSTVERNCWIRRDADKLTNPTNDNKNLQAVLFFVIWRRCAQYLGSMSLLAPLAFLCDSITLMKYLVLNLFYYLNTSCVKVGAIHVFLPCNYCLHITTMCWRAFINEKNKSLSAPKTRKNRAPATGTHTHAACCTGIIIHSAFPTWWLSWTAFIAKATLWESALVS